MNHLYPGKVIRGDPMMEAKGTAWINEPTAFVITDGSILYR